MPFVIANGTAAAILDRSGIGGNKWTFKVNPSNGTLAGALVGHLVDAMPCRS